MNFSDHDINMQALKARAYNLRWATLPADVIPLTAADPDFKSAPEIADAIQAYAAERVFTYQPAEGLPAFRKTIAETINKRRNIQTSQELVIPVDSAAQGMFITSKYCLEPGDEAIIFDPVDFLFKKSIEIAGGIPIYFPINVKEGTYDIEYLRSLINERTKMLCICNPHNPIGKVFTKTELELLGQIAIENDLWIMSDEIWSDIIFPGNVYTSIASISKEIAERTITIYGFSKTFGLAGLRVGFMLAPNAVVYEGLMETSLMRTTAYGVSGLSQTAAQAAYEKSWYWVDGFVNHLTQMRDYTIDRLNKMKNVSCHLPQGCYLAFPDISATGKTSIEIADYLMTEAKVAVVPGAEKWFGPGAEGHIRICFSTSKNILDEALNRMERAFERL
ncbi:MAG: hypothetical protein JWN76_3354 [Chitinophagaceae bacterium]|nr:hypothetical protein [Chitinophagaceae bacterium]